MKHLALLVLTAGLTTPSFGQKGFILFHQEKRGFATLSAGTSVPVGHFAGHSPVNERAGMAGRGVAFSGSAGYRLLGRVGLVIRGEHHRNPMHTDGLIHTLYRNETDSWTAEAGNWTVTTLLGGPYVTLPLNRFSLDARILVGRATATLPGTSLAGNFGEEQIAIYTTGARSQAWAYAGGLTLQYRLSRSFALHVNGDYTRSAMTFDNLTSEVQSNGNRSQRVTFSRDHPISVVSGSAGVSVLLGGNRRPF